MFLASLWLIIPGILYIVFAFRDPPEIVESFFRIPTLFVFLPPERRAKLGRILVGALLIASGVGWMLWDLYHRIFGWQSAIPRRDGAMGGSRIVAAVLVIGLIGLQIAAKWKRAGEVSDARDAELRDKWQSFEILKRDPRFVHLQHQLYTKGYRTTFERAADPTTYRVAYLALQGERDPYLLAQHNPPARWLAAYLERDAAPKRVVVSLDLQNGVCHEREAGLFDWGFLPGRPTSA